MRRQKRNVRKLIGVILFGITVFFSGVLFKTEMFVHAAENNLTQTGSADTAISEETYTITVNALLGEQTVESPVIKFTDSAGNETTASGLEVQLKAGEYSYVVSDGGYNRVEGTLNVSENMELQADLPTGEWFGEIQVRDKGKKAFLSKQNKDIHEAEFYIDDTVGEDELYLYAEQGAVPEALNTRLITCYIGTDEEDKSLRDNSWNSGNNTLPKCLNTGMEGREFQLEARYEANGYTQIQSYTMKLIRIPTLQSLVIKENGAEGMTIFSDFSADVTEYDVTTDAENLYVDAASYETEGYSITGDGVVEIGEQNPMEHIITVSHTNGMSRAYVFHIAKTDAVCVNLCVADGTTLCVYNKRGIQIAPTQISENKYTYALIPKETYTYIATKDTYFHTSADFVADDNLEVAVAEPETSDAMHNLALYDSAKPSIRDAYSSNTEFSPELHSYVYTITDENSSVAVQATVAEKYEAVAHYSKQSVISSQHGVTYEKTITAKVDEKSDAVTLQKAIAACGYGQSITIRLSKKENDITWYQDYEIQCLRLLHLSDLKVESAEGAQYLLDQNAAVVDFDSEINDYDIEVSKETENLTLNGAYVNEKSTTDICGGYYVEINGQRYDKLEDIAVSITEEENQTIEITVKHVNTESIVNTYRLQVKKLEKVKVSFVTEPENAIVFVRHSKTGKSVYADADGVYDLVPGNTYSYTVTANGYVAQYAEDYKVPQKDVTISVSLEKAAENPTIDSAIEAQWSSFRNTADNNCVTNVKMPTESEDASLYWATKLGSGYGSKATGCPIIVDGYLYTYAGTTIYKIDTVNGAVVATGKMAEASSYAINPPTYAKGMIFIGLKDGRVQAFNAKTLESLWLYEDEIGGQPNCPITYHDGYIYTGFWKGETKEANYVCISVTDEDTTNATESKRASWTYTGMGGFYWAGAYVCDDYMLVGTDDGCAGYTTGYGHVLSIDPMSGKILGDITLPFTGDVRSSITLYDGKFYFTTKGGYFYELSVNADGTFAEEPLRSMKLENGSDSSNTPAMSTSTPTIYQGRAYVGVSGISQFGAYSGHNISVLDINEWKIAYSVKTQGYPQTSGLLTTAYEETTKKAYIYFFDNYTPGKLRIISDQPGQTKATEVTVEEYMQAGTKVSCDAAKVLFTPTGNHAQYALCTPIVDEYGTIYFKNDSAYLMAVGSRIEKIKVVKQPDKTCYKAGEIFEPEGMQILAFYSNGMTKDVTQYVTYSQNPLTSEDEDFSIQFPYVLYQDKNGETGADCEKPLAAVHLKIVKEEQEKPPVSDKEKEESKEESKDDAKLLEIPAKTATLSKDGNIRYWKDAVTGKLYADAAGKHEITEEETIVYRPSEMKLSVTEYSYNGKAKKPKVTVKNRKGTALKKNRDYTVTYAIGRKNVGRYTVKITFKGDYTGSRKLYFYINPAATSIKKVTAESKKLTVTYKRTKKQISGYEIQYATNAKFKKPVTMKVKSKNTTKQTIGNLKVKQKYYVRVRTYQTVKIGGKNKKLYSKWSSAKAVTIKK